MRLYVHEILFPQSLRLFGASEQYNEWIDDVLKWRIIGSFAMVCLKQRWKYSEFDHLVLRDIMFMQAFN